MRFCLGKKKKKKKKKELSTEFEPGSTDTKGYRPIRLHLILRGDIGRYAYNSEGVSGYAKRAWGEH